jgi:glucose-1-phosphate adenylyltransferase
LALAADGRIERFVEKPQSIDEIPAATHDSVLASMGIYVFSGSSLAHILGSDAADPTSGHDFGADILPRLIEGGSAYSYASRSAGGTAKPYWRDIGTLAAYWRTHMELLGRRPLLTLDDPRWPIGRAAAPLIVSQSATGMAGGRIEDSVIAAGCNVAGHVLRSV